MAKPIRPTTAIEAVHDQTEMQADTTTIEAVHVIGLGGGLECQPGQMFSCSHEEAARLISMGAAR